MSVHYKFKSNLNPDTVTFDGLHISVGELKKSIMQQKKIGKCADFDLQITNAQTKEVYDNEETLVPKNTSVIVARVPISSGNKKTWDKQELPLLLDDDESSGQIRFDVLVKNADLVNANVTEDDKVKAMINQSSVEYDPSKYMKSRNMTGPTPPNYVCYRCGKQGHWIKNCPTNTLDIKRSTGIPRSFMVPVDGPEHKGALLTSSGDYAVPLIDHQAYKEVKREKPPFVKDMEAPAQPEAEIPEELLCMFCKSLLQDAVLIPCCGNSFCDECVRQALLDSDEHQCPVCNEVDISPDTVIPNRFLRTAVLNFKNETGYTRLKRPYQPAENQPPRIESPQPSPDSTVETHPSVPEVAVEVKSEHVMDIKQPILELSAYPEDAEDKIKDEIDNINEEEGLEDIQPGTPLADEPAADDVESVEPVGHNDKTYSPSYSQPSTDEYDIDSREGERLPEPQHISTILTVNHYGKNRFQPHGMSQYSSQSSHHHRHHDDRSNDMRDSRSDYRSRYDHRRNFNDRHMGRGMRVPSRYDRTIQDNRYRRPENHHEYRNYRTDMQVPRTSIPHYEVTPATDTSSIRPPAETPVLLKTPPTLPDTQTVEVAPAIPEYIAPPPVRPPCSTTTSYVSTSMAPALPTPPPTFPPQPPPPGASPIDHSLIPPQPPPPGVDPLLLTQPSVLPEAPASFTSSAPSFKQEETKPAKEEQSIDDRIEAFQRELEKRGRESARERDSTRDLSSRSSSRSRTRSHSSSRSSHSRSYKSSKSWSRSSSRTARSSRSRSRSAYSSRSRSRSRSRSYSRSRSRSRSKGHSYSKSRSRSLSHRSRSKSRSRSRSRERRRSDSPRNRVTLFYKRNHSSSHSPSPRTKFPPRGRRSPYPGRRTYDSPQYTPAPAPAPPPPPQPPPPPPPTYSSAYSTAPPAMPIATVVRPTHYPPPHVPVVHPVQQPPVPHPISHYAIESQRYQYGNQFTPYDPYPHAPKHFIHPRYEREQRNPRFEHREYQRDYQRRPEEIQHRIPGWIGDRNRDFRPRYRIIREQKKEIKELPKLMDHDMRIREPKDENYFRKRDESSSSKRKEDISMKRSDSSAKRKDESSKRREDMGKKREESSKRKEKDIIIKKKDEAAVKKRETAAIASSKQKSVVVKKKEEKVSKHKKHHHHKSKENKKQEVQENKIPVVVGASDVANLVKVEVTENTVDTKKNSNVESLEEPIIEKTKEKKHKHKKHKANDQAVKKKKVPKKIKPEIKEGSDPAVKVKVKKKKNKVKQEQIIHNEETAVDPEVPKLHTIKTEEADTLTVNIDDLKLEIEAPDGVTEGDKTVPFEETEVRQGQLEEDSSATVMEQEILADELHETTDDLGVAIPGTEPAEEAEVEENQPVEEEEEEEEEDEEEAIDELHVKMPELSKWEREDYEEEMALRPQRKSSVDSSKDEREILSSDIIQRAEKAILQKSLKKAIVVTTTGKEKKVDRKSVVKVESQGNSPQASVTSIIAQNVESVPQEEESSPALQVTITTDKRSVRTKSSDTTEVIKEETTKQAIKPKRIKVNFPKDSDTKSEEGHHRTVIVEEHSAAKKREEKHKKDTSQNIEVKQERSKKHAQEHQDDQEDTQRKKKGTTDKKNKDRSHSSDRAKKHSEKRPKESVVYAVDKSKKIASECTRDVRYVDNRDAFRHVDRSARERYHRRSRSRSPDSMEATYMARRFDHRPDYRYGMGFKDRSDHDPDYARRFMHGSPSRKGFERRINIKGEAYRDTYYDRGQTKHLYHDMSKFEPSYDEYSDSDEKDAAVERSRLRKRSRDRDTHRKRVKSSSSSSEEEESSRRRKRKIERESSTSSSSSSSSSETESSDDNIKTSKAAEHKTKHKKSKHKKRKKHKHKHKKKKSHKSKKD